MKTSTSNIKLKRLAKEFNLKYNSQWFNFILVPRRQLVLNNFIIGCPDPSYNKFGKSYKLRIKNLDKFLKSKEYKKIVRRAHGGIKLKEDLEKDIKSAQLIKNKKVRQEYLDIFKKARPKFKSNILALVTKPRTKKESKLILQILTHEWEHVLLMKNNIYFQRKGRKYWPLDEGLVTYFDAFLGKYISKLDAMQKREKNTFLRQYISNAVKWKKLLEGKTKPKERKKAILNYYKSLPILKRKKK